MVDVLEQFDIHLKDLEVNLPDSLSKHRELTLGSINPFGLGEEVADGFLALFGPFGELKVLRFLKLMLEVVAFELVLEVVAASIELL